MGDSRRVSFELTVEEDETHVESFCLDCHDDNGGASWSIAPEGYVQDAVVAQSKTRNVEFAYATACTDVASEGILNLSEAQTPSFAAPADDHRPPDRWESPTVRHQHDVFVALHQSQAVSASA